MVMVTEEIAYAQLVLGRVERAFPGKGIVLAQPLERCLPPAGGAVLPAGQGDKVAARLEHGPDGRGIASSDLCAIIDIQHQRPAVVDDPDGRADDIIDLLRVQQAVALRDRGGRVISSETAQGFLIQHNHITPFSHQADLLHAAAF